MSNDAAVRTLYAGGLVGGRSHVDYNILRTIYYIILYIPITYIGDRKVFRLILFFVYNIMSDDDSPVFFFFFFFFYSPKVVIFLRTRSL